MQPLLVSPRQPDPKSVRILVWGTYDLSKPRMRIILDALKAAGANVTEMHVPVWEGIDDKSSLRSAGTWLRVVLRFSGSLIRLCLRYLLAAPEHDVILVGYLGLFDVLAIWPLARLRRKRIVWDAFLSVHDTLVADRALMSSKSLRARTLWQFERLACVAADRVVLDTATHAERVRRLFILEARRVASVPVGAEAWAFPPLSPKRRGRDSPLRLLFYGQFIPLHGIETIFAAARLASGRPWTWRIIGTGQEAARLREALQTDPIATVEWVHWVPYENLSSEIAEADICLGIFGASDKAASVIPNKVYQVIASGRPLITRDSPAMRELAAAEIAGIELVPHSDPAAIVAATARLEATISAEGWRPGRDYSALRQRFAPETLGRQWMDLLKTMGQ